MQKPKWNTRSFFALASVVTAAILLAEVFVQAAQYLSRPRILQQSGNFDLNALAPIRQQFSRVAIHGIVARKTGLYFSVVSAANKSGPFHNRTVIHTDHIGNLIRTIDLPPTTGRQLGAIDVDSAGRVFAFEEVPIDSRHVDTFLLIYDSDGELNQRRKMPFSPQAFCVLGGDVVMISNQGQANFAMDPVSTAIEAADAPPSPFPYQDIRFWRPMLQPLGAKEFIVIDGSSPDRIYRNSRSGRVDVADLRQPEIGRVMTQIRIHQQREKDALIPSQLVGAKSLATDTVGDVFLPLTMHKLQEGAVILRYTAELMFKESIRAMLSQHAEYTYGSDPLRLRKDYGSESGPLSRQGFADGRDRLGYMRLDELAVVDGVLYIADMRGKVAFYDL